MRPNIFLFLPLSFHRAGGVASRDLLADTWLKKREIDLDDDARKIEGYRVELSLMWANMMRVCVC